MSCAANARPVDVLVLSASVLILLFLVSDRLLLFAY
jgi:hypothetical protein